MTTEIKTFKPMHNKSLRHLVTYMVPLARTGELPRMNGYYTFLDDIDTGFVALSLLNELHAAGHIRQAIYFVEKSGSMVLVTDDIDMSKNPVTGKPITANEFISKCKTVIEMLDEKFFDEHFEMYELHDAQIEMLLHELNGANPDISDFSVEAAKDTTVQAPHETATVYPVTK